MTAPDQAVILCGGLGTRLKPLTDSLPKPMAPVNGRPFLEYLIQQLREQGMTRVVLLTGYLGEQIRDHFGDGSSFGVSIAYSQGPAEWETGQRLWEAREWLAAQFVLMYSDNYAPFSRDDLWAFHTTAGSTISLLLQPKSRGNVQLHDDGRVARYDSTRTAPGLNLVEIGYMMVNRDGLLDVLLRDVSLSATLTRLADQGKLAGKVAGTFYQSISDLERLRKAEQYLAFKKVLLIDRDGTINARPPKAEYVTGWDRFVWEPSTVDGMQQLAAKGFTFIVLSNQAGIARGMLSPGQVEAVNQRVTEELRALGVEILAWYVCPHHWDDGCTCRKPAPGMFYQASLEHGVRLNRTIYVGDDPRDAVAAHNAGCLSALVGPDRHGQTAAPAAYQGPTRSAESLTDLIPWILDTFEAWEAVP
jgi:histidinol-phosphate phosphatase family protein